MTVFRSRCGEAGDHVKYKSKRLLKYETFVTVPSQHTTYITQSLTSRIVGTNKDMLTVDMYRPNDHCIDQ